MSGYQISTNTSSILLIGGHDPSGAGMQADIETIIMHKCHAISVLTCTTAQNTSTVNFVRPISPDDFRTKISTLLEEFKPKVIKIGLVPNFELCREINYFIENIDHKTEIIVDPIIRAGSGNELTEKSQSTGLKTFLLTGTTLLTPNRSELFALTQTNNFVASLKHLFVLGVENILATDITSDPGTITNAFASRKSEKIFYYTHPRISGEFHGSGCTLASAIACGLAKSKNLNRSVLEAIHFANKAIANAHELGIAQRIPDRSAGLTE